MSCAAYLSELILMSKGSQHAVMCRMVWACTVVGHSRYHQNLASGQCPPVAVRLEPLCAMPKGMQGMRYVIGQDFGVQGEDKVLLMRCRSRRRSLPM